MSQIDLRECDNCGEVVRQYPLFAGVVVTVLGGLTYAGISLAMDGRISPLELGVFAVVFGVGYTGGKYLWDRV